jgi:selenocysteine lyase/cysteine desulfurase
MGSRELHSRRHALAILGALTGSSLLPGGARAAPASSDDDAGLSADPWSRARAQLVLNPRLAYFDTAQFGPSTRAVLASVYRAEEALHTDPGAFFEEHYSADAVLNLCQRMGTWLDCNADEVCFTGGTLEGVMQVGQALALQPGDEVLINAQLPEALQRFWRQQVRQCGLVMKTINLPMPLNSQTEVLAAFENAMSERSRVLVCSHLQHGDGAVLPIRELCQLARTHGLISIIEGTLTLGALQFSVRDLGCDVYASSLCHWLNGPQRTGVLFVREALQPSLQDEVSTGAEPTLLRNLSSWPALQRHWPAAFVDKAAQFQSVATALAWQEAFGRVRIEARLRELQLYARLRLQNIDGLQIITPAVPGMWLQLLSIKPGRRSAIDLAEWLRSNDKVIVSGFRGTQDGLNVLRVSLHLYNSHDEIERLAQGLQRAARA